MTAHTITDLNRLWEELAQVRLRGYAIDHEEVEEGLMCLGAPIRNHQGQTIAAISLAGPVARVLPCEEQYGRRVAATAQEISLALGYVPRLATDPSLAPG